jgi:hypothetical protein
MAIDLGQSKRIRCNLHDTGLQFRRPCFAVFKMSREFAERL